MRKSELTYTDKIQWRVRGWRCVLVALFGYMVAISLLGGGDSRIQTRLADFVGDIILFGGMIYAVCRIVRNKKLLKDRVLLRKQHQREQDERNQYLHDKSGGVVWDTLLICLLFITTTAAQFNMAAFYAVFSVLVIAVLLKLAAYLIYSRY